MKFSYAEIESYCIEMYNISSMIKEKLDSINSHLNNFESSQCWQGNGYQYYFDKLKNVTNSFEEVNLSIINNIHYLEQTAESYNSLDKKIIMSVINTFSISESDD